MLPIPIPNIPLPNVGLPFPLPGLSEPLFTVMLIVAGIGFYNEGKEMFFQIAQPETEREYRMYAIQAAFPIGMFALDYATGDLSGVLFWGVMYLFNAVRLRYGYSMAQAIQAVVAIVIATIRRIVREIRKRLP